MFNNIKTAAQVALEEAELAQRQSELTFKRDRQALLDAAVVTANTFQFNADEVSITRMTNALLAVSGEADTFAMQWSLADTGTGVMTNITLGDLKLAHQLAVQNMSNIWSI
jgi:hypothetical protein